MSGQPKSHYFTSFVTRPDFFIPLTALAVRFIYLLHIQSSPFFDSPELDSAMHDRWAREIVAGEFGEGEPFFRAPLYYYFLALIYKIFGHSYFIPRLMQIFFGAFGSWLTYRLGVRIFDKNAGIIAGLIVALCGPLIYFDAELRIPALLIPLILLTLIQLDRQREHPTNWGFLISGALLGLAALARPNILIFVPFVWIWILWIVRGRLRWLILFTLGILLLVLPVTLRNYLQSDDFVLIASQAGVNFYIGNNPQSDGYTAIVPGTPGDWEGGYHETIRIAEAAAGRELKSSEVSRYWFGRTVKEISDDPGRWVSLICRKFRLLFSGHEIGNNDDIYFQRRYSWLLSLLMWEKIIAFPFGILLPLGLLGFILKSDRRRNALPLLFFISYSVSIIAFFVCTRFRLPLIPLLAVWAGFAVTRIFHLLKKRDYRPLMLSVLLFIILLLAANQNPLAGEGICGFEGAFFLAGKYYDRGDYAKSVEAYEETLTLDSQSADAHNGLAMALIKSGRREEARRHLETAVTLSPSLVKAQNNLGQFYLQSGNTEQAYDRFKAVLQIDSTDVFANRGIADIAYQQGTWQEAEDYYQRAYVAGAKDRQLISRWANSVLQQSNYIEALRINAILLEQEPDNARAHHNHAKICIACDSLQLAKRELEIVMRLDPGNVEARAELEELERIK